MLIPNYHKKLAKDLPQNPTLNDLCDWLVKYVPSGPIDDQALATEMIRARTDEDAYAAKLVELGRRSLARDIVNGLAEAVAK